MFQGTQFSLEHRLFQDELICSSLALSQCQVQELGLLVFLVPRAAVEIAATSLGLEASHLLAPCKGGRPSHQRSCLGGERQILAVRTQSTCATSVTPCSKKSRMFLGMLKDCAEGA